MTSQLVPIIQLPRWSPISVLHTTSVIRYTQHKVTYKKRSDEVLSVSFVSVSKQPATTKYSRMSKNVRQQMSLTRADGSAATTVAGKRLQVKELPWSAFLLEKLMVAKIAKKRLAFYATQRSIIVPSKRRHWSLSWPTLLRSVTTKLIYFRPTVILLSQPRLQLPVISWQGSLTLFLNDLSPGFATNFLLPFSSHAS